MLLPRQSWRRKGAREFGNATPGEIAKTLFSYYQACITCRNADFQKNTLYVKYEHLVQEPAATAAIIQEFSGIDLRGFDPNSNDENREKMQRSFQAEGNPFHSEHYGKAVTSKRIGRYEEVLSQDEIRKIEETCKKLLDILGQPTPTFSIK